MMQDVAYAEADLIHAHSDSRIHTKLRVAEAKVSEKTESLTFKANVEVGHSADQRMREDLEHAAGHHVEAGQVELRKRTPRTVCGTAANYER